MSLKNWSTSTDVVRMMISCVAVVRVSHLNRSFEVLR
jgi:hypothetical protein